MVVDFQIRDAAPEVSGLLQWKDEGGNVVHHALALIVPALFYFQPVDDAAVDDQGGRAVVAFDGHFEPVTVLDAVTSERKSSVPGSSVRPSTVKLTV